MWDPPTTPELFAKVAYAALTYQSLTGSSWCGTDKPFSKPKWIGLRDALMDKKWVEWIDPEHHPLGLRVTATGKRKLALWLEEYGQSRALTRTHAGGALLEQHKGE